MKVICITDISPSTQSKCRDLTVGKTYHVISSHPRNGHLLQPTYYLMDDRGGTPTVYYASQFREADDITNTTTVSNIGNAGVSCTKCGEYNSYQSGPFTCYQCRN